MPDTLRIPPSLSKGIHLSHPVQTPCVLGIDIAKKTFQCALLKAGKFKHKSFENHAEGDVALSHWLNIQGAGDAVHVCLEATGSYGERSLVI